MTPILSCFTFIGLLLTIYLQRRELGASAETLQIVKQELEHAKKASDDTIEFNKNEVIRRDLSETMAMVSAELLDRFEVPADFSPAGQTFGYYFSFSAPSAGLADIPMNGQLVSGNDQKLIIDLAQLIGNMCLYINDYEARFGNTALVYHYKYRYRTLNDRLKEKGFIVDFPFNPFKTDRLYYLGQAPNPEGRH